MPDTVVERALRLQLSAQVLTHVRHNDLALYHLYGNVLGLLSVSDIQDETTWVEGAELQENGETIIIEGPSADYV